MLNIKFTLFFMVEGGKGGKGDGGGKGGGGSEGGFKN